MSSLIIAPDRFKFVNKIYNEMTSEANTNDRKDQKEYFLQLVEGKFGSIYKAIWTRGAIVNYNEGKKKFIYLGAQYVVLKSLNNSSTPGKAFFDEVIHFRIK